jgi:hypothetical protein
MIVLKKHFYLKLQMLLLIDLNIFEYLKDEQILNCDFLLQFYIFI